MTLHSNEFWEIAIAANAAFKGLLASSGQSGHICASVIKVETHFSPAEGWPAIVTRAAQAVSALVRDGDTVVIAEKVVAAAQNRLAPRRILLDPDPKTVSAAVREELARRWQQELGFRVTPLHLLLADEYPGDLAT